MPLLRPLHPSPALARYLADDPLYLRNYFWADGTIRVSSRDYSGMIESWCMESRALSCTSCHSLHDSDPVNLLAAGKDPTPRASCHPAIGRAPGPYPPRGRLAGRPLLTAACHTVYGLLRASATIGRQPADHRRRRAGPGRPNACNPATSAEPRLDGARAHALVPKPIPAALVPAPTPRRRRSPARLRRRRPARAARRGTPAGKRRSASRVARRCHP
jgi:hypothetical protein